jgi:hypothetical protein
VRVGWWWGRAGCGRGCDEAAAGNAGAGESAGVAGVAGEISVPDWLVEGGAGSCNVLSYGLGQIDGLAVLDDVNDDDDFDTDDVDFRGSWGDIWTRAEGAIFISRIFNI